MPIYRIVDGHVLSETEYAARADDIARHLRDRANAAASVTPLEISGGRSLTPTAPAPRGDNIGFTPIGPNLPLTVLIRHVYTGKYPDRNRFRHRGDMAIVSGVKNFAAFDATARAVNFLAAEVGPHSHFNGPSAFDRGTPVVLYSPAVTDSAITITFEMATANDFVKGLLDKFSSALQSAAGIPVFLPYAGYLLGASSIIKLGDGVADALYESQTAFLRTEIINFSLPGAPPATADWRIVCNPAFSAANYSYVDGTGLIDRNGEPYNGDEPYLVMSLDGAKNDALKGFSPHVAAAAVLQTFFNVRDGSQAGIETVVGALSVFSDLQYRKQADTLKEELAATPDGPAKESLQKQYDAAVANIVEQALKPGST
jgi:hypothetical protein